MAISLAEVKKGLQDKITAGVIDEFQKSNYLLDTMVFDDTVLPAGNGAALTYGYYRVLSDPAAAFRPVNSEYVSGGATKDKVTVDLKIFGGSFEIDRVLAGAGGFISEVDFQSRQMVKAAQELFNETVINGDSMANAFDGLDKALTGKSTEYNASSSVIDLSTSAAVDTNYKEFLDKLDEFILKLDGRPSALLGNTAMIAKIRACARRAGGSHESIDSFGRQVATYDGIPLVDMGAKSGSANPVIPIGTGASLGQTSLYAVRLGLDGLHGVSISGQSPVNVWLPDYATSGAVKKGEVEMVAAIALKSTGAAGIFRKIKVA